MTILDTDLSAKDFEVGIQYRTNDGKVVTLKEVDVEEDLPRADLASAAKGDIFVLRSGERFTCTGVRADAEGEPVWLARNEYSELWFWFDGASRPLGPDKDVVELIKVEKPVVSLEGLQVGDRFRTRDGAIFICTKLKSFSSPIWAESKKWGGIYFRWNGNSNIVELQHDLVAVERLESNLISKIQVAIEKNGRENVVKVVVNEEEWEQVRKEAEEAGFYRDYSVLLGRIKVFFSTGSLIVPKGSFNIQLKF